VNADAKDPGIDPAAIRLPEDLGMYLDELRARFDSIEEVWLIGPRVDADDAREAPWEFLLFADVELLEALRRDSSWWRDGTAAAVVTDGERVEPAWGSAPAGSLQDWQWRLASPRSARYAKHGAGLLAVRIR
jgi:hypothetical protein